MQMATQQQHDKNYRRTQTFKLHEELIARLGHYVVDRSIKEGHRIEKSEVAEQALDRFLKEEDY
jgi:hypothetical protein